MNEEDDVSFWRNVFAAAALIGLIAAPVEEPLFPFRNLGEEAFEFADLMLEESRKAEEEARSKASPR